MGYSSIHFHNKIFGLKGFSRAALLFLCAVGLEALSAETTTPAIPDTALESSAEVVELPSEKNLKAQPAAPVDAELDENLIREKAALTARKNAALPKPLEPNKPVEPAPASAGSRPAALDKLSEPGFASVLTGTLKSDLELSADGLPHLIRGQLVIPANVTLKFAPGAVVHLRSDSTLSKCSNAELPDPSQSAVVWIYGRLIVAGESGKPVEFLGLDKDCDASLLLYGSQQSRVDGARFKGVDVAQRGGVCQWTNCEFNDAKYYALASGAGLFTHCSFTKCGGIFAAYEDGPWALLARKCLFENCRDGLMFGRDPGAACLCVEKNNFIGTRGANLRMLPRASASIAAAGKAPEELLVGENWYGTRVEEEIDHRIVDNRSDRAIKAHLNTRPPAEKPYQTIGAGVAPAVTAATLQEQQGVSLKLLQSLAARQKLVLERSKFALDRSTGDRLAAKKELK